MGKVKIVHRKLQGEMVKGAYDIFLGDVHLGVVRRHDGVADGYFGRWSAGRFYTDTRKQAVDYLVHAHERRAR